MTGIVDFAIGRARMILAIFVCALIAGLIAFATLPRCVFCLSVAVWTDRHHR